MSARYQVLTEGVLDRTTGRVLHAWTPDFQEYRAWLDQGNTPDPADPPTAAALDRSYYREAGDARASRELAKLSDDEFLQHLRKGNP